MGFFKTTFNEFGKKTGKALGNKLYGAYADDRRVGVNRGKLKGESDGLKITTSEKQQSIRQTNIKEVEKQNQKLFDKILKIELNPNSKDSLIKSLTTLSTYVELGMKEGLSDECFVLAKSKFNDGAAMLQAIAPNHSMTKHFLQKKSQWKKEKNKKWIGLSVLLIVCFAIMLGMVLFADKT